MEFVDESEEEFEEFWEEDWPEFHRGRRGGGGRRGGEQPRRGKQQHIGRWIRVDWIETADHHILQIDLPGVKKDRLHLKVEGNRMLVICGEKHRDKPDKEKGEKARFYERFGGEFSRSFRMPKDAKIDEITATMEDGVLTVTIAKIKSAEQKPDVKNINIQFAQQAGGTHLPGTQQQQSAATAAT
ncbi:16.9 kDa class I heat shock protein 1 [Selaginella moellendorffii]|uniref:16.9 kDa class I heat shock protein 1 n=1 Tax=Selaginella moellendorffii TaxID=88036 RepID=UPI000D1C73EE|nr:16.9 kDa class I heat shock protein 1 [Selaginella moellendorffii]|eukprot:XP_024536809.1 16.9 kDa class I heat shock protein 1 [Selaginella moellendorffii]